VCAGQSKGWSVISYDTQSSLRAKCVCVYECVCAYVDVCAGQSKGWSVISYDTQPSLHAKCVCVRVCVCKCVYVIACVCVCWYMRVAVRSAGMILLNPPLASQS